MDYGRNLAAIEHRRKQITILLLTLHAPTVRKIQELLQQAYGIKVGLGTVARDMIAIRDEWRQERLANMDEVVGRELAKLDLVEENAWLAYRLGSRPITKTITRNRQVTVRVPRELTPGQGSVLVDEIRTLTTTDTEQWVPPPDTKPLEVVVRAMERRAKMLALDPERGTTINIALLPPDVIRQATSEELEEIEAGRYPPRIAALVASTAPADPGAGG